MAVATHIWLQGAACLAGVAAGWPVARVASRYGDLTGRGLVPLCIALTGLVFLWGSLVVPPTPILIPTLLLGWLLTALAAVDLAAFRLPDVLTAPMAAAGLLTSVWLPGGPWLDHALATGGGFIAIAGLGWAYERLRGREGIGLGDAKLLGAAGAWLGWRALPSVVLVASAVALVWVAGLFIRQGDMAMRARLAFGGPLCLAIWLVWLYGPLTLG